MIFKWFIKNEWRQARRSSMWEQALGVKIFLGFLFFIIFAEMIGGSIVVASKFEEIFPDDDPVEKFNSFLLYGFGLGFLLRFFMQKVPVLSIQPYLHLPIKKSTLVNYVLGKSLLSFFNFIPIVLFTPFIIFQMAPWYSGLQITGYVFAIIFSVLAVNFLNILFKRNLSGNNWISGIIALVIIGLGFLDHYKLLSVSDFSSFLFSALLTQPVWILIPLFILTLAYTVNFKSLLIKLYPEENVRFKKGSKKTISDIKYLKQFGTIGELILLEIKLFLRNKRPKSSLIFLPIFLLYGFIFYTQDIYMSMTGMLIFVGAFMTGPVLMIYGQYLLSWESSYFDGILTHIDDFHQYFRAKYYIMVGASLAAYIITIPYVYYGTEILYINTATMLFNVGVGPLFVLLMATNNKKRLDLSKGAAFNYQGVSATQFLMSFPILLMPLLVYLPFWAFGQSMAGIIAIGIIGIVAFAFNKSLINLAVQRFINRKYIIANGFRQKY
ncbi:MAG: hypothetical protein B6D64_05200 [Bacteroidetes bacterium 4484_276]|nr:MAG: hypothetical protein B6D64_05200 [Bacteroidetes bacterium 4484_276]